MLKSFPFCLATTFCSFVINGDPSHLNLKVILSRILLRNLTVITKGRTIPKPNLSTYTKVLSGLTCELRTRKMMYR